jgi:capsular polysaccharide biosynthesis protein
MFGGLLGLGFSKLQTSQYEALATILVRAPEGISQPGRHVLNQTTIMTSTPVLERAAERYGADMDIALARRLVSVQASDVADVITVRALGSDADTAERLADAVVTSYLTIGQETGQAAPEAVAQIQEQEGVLRERIADVESALRGNTDDPALLAEIEALTDDLGDRVTSELRLTLGDTSDASPAVVLGEAEASRVKDKVLQRAGLGALIGLAVSLGIVLWRRPGREAGAATPEALGLRIDDRQVINGDEQLIKPMGNGKRGLDLPARRSNVGRLI